MNNLTDIKLGAPESIEITKECPNAKLSVQIASRINNISLHDENFKCTSDGAIVTAAKLLRQKMKEASITESTWEGMTAHYGGTLADVIANGGNLQLSVHDAGGNPVKVCWQIAEIIEAEEGATASISQDGLLTLTEGKKIQGKVRAVNWENNMEKVIFYFVVNAELGSIISQHYEYLDLLIEYPPLINSLVDTGKRNFIIQFSNADAGLINTGIICSADMSFRSVVKPHIIEGTHYVFGGGGSEIKYCMFQLFVPNGSNTRTNMRYASTENNKTDADIQDRWGEYKFDANSYSVLGITTVRAATPSSFVVKDTAPIYIFGAMRNDDGTSYMRNTNPKGNSLSIEVIEIRKGEELHKFVPFVRNGQNGLLDLYDLSFHGNAHTAGSFEIITENKE